VVRRVIPDRVRDCTVHVPDRSTVTRELPCFRDAGARVVGKCAECAALARHTMARECVSGGTLRMADDVRSS
jgi:hypothetical protein